MDGKPAATLLAMMLAMLLPAFGLLGMASPR
jgi:hypothetical protein